MQQDRRAIQNVRAVWSFYVFVRRDDCSVLVVRCVNTIIDSTALSPPTMLILTDNNWYITRTVWVEPRLKSLQRVSVSLWT